MDDPSFIERLKEALVADGLAPATIQRTVIDCRQFEGFLRKKTGEELDPDDLRLTALDLAEFRDHLQAAGMGAGTIRRKVQSVRKAVQVLDLALAVRLRWPRLPQQQLTAPSGFSRNERHAILRAAEEHLSTRDRAIVKLLLLTGGRASSIAAAKLSKIQIGERGGSIEFDLVKNDRHYAVPLNAEARAAVQEWLAERPPVEHGYIFTAERYPYAPISRWVVHQIWHDRLRKHLPKPLADRLRGPHQARHDLARRLLSGDEGQNGHPTPVADVAAIMGHADPRICVAVYSRPSQEAMQRALDGIGEENGDR